MRRENAKVRLSAAAARQWGRITSAQLHALGVDRRVISDWLAQGHLHRVLPRVYAVGHNAPSVEADLAAALLYAGPGASLSHATAAWWLGLLDEQPRSIHVSTPRRCRSLPAIVVHQPRDPDRIWHRCLPVTSVAQTLVDFSAKAPLRLVRLALAKADYRETLDLDALEAALGRGRSGSAKLRLALGRHERRLARTKSGLEIAFIELCESGGIPIPEVNVRIAGWEVDALFRSQGIAVELDGYRNHRSPTQVKRDRRKEMDLRAAGLVPVRYSDEQLGQGRHDVLVDLRRLGVA